MLRHHVLPPLDGGPARLWCMVLHGLGDSHQGWLPIVDELRLSGLGWIFVDAPDPYYGGWSWFPIPGMTDPAHGPEEFNAGLNRSRALLDELIGHLELTREIPAERLLLWGFSQGCLMAIDQALRGPRRFAGVLGISGWIAAVEEYPAAFGAHACEQDMLVTHGDEDPILPVERSRAAIARLCELGCRIDWREYHKAHSLDAQRELPEIRAWVAARLGC